LIASTGKEVSAVSDSKELPTELRKPRRHLFLSPHYDDIPLSAGATVNVLARAGVVPETLVVFGDEPDAAQPLTPFAEAMHEGWQLSANEVIARRRAEEAAAAAILGAATDVLPFRDAIYRGRHYLSDDDLFGVPAAAEDRLPEAIAAALPYRSDPSSQTRLYAPLAVGSHVDHQLVFRAALAFARKGRDVWFYEDIPYALKPNQLDERLRQITAEIPLEPVARVPVADAWERKLEAILAYPSQLETVFRQYVGVGTSRAEISDALLAYARRAGDGDPVERFWRVVPTEVSAGS
jgi:LmbE family N-acetylglucosaminyl deacetylase